MKTAIRIWGEVTADGRLVLDLPKELPRGPVVVSFEFEDESDFELQEQDLLGAGLRAREIADAPEIGAWADEGVESGAEFVEQIRRAPARYTW